MPHLKRSPGEKAKHSLVLRLLAAVGWISLRIVKIGWKLLAFTGSRVARRKLQELEQRRGGKASADPLGSPEHTEKAAA